METQRHLALARRGLSYSPRLGARAPPGPPVPCVRLPLGHSMAGGAVRAPWPRAAVLPCPWQCTDRREVGLLVGCQTCGLPGPPFSSSSLRGWPLPPMAQSPMLRHKVLCKLPAPGHTVVAMEFRGPSPALSKPPLLQPHCERLCLRHLGGSSCTSRALSA